jgi:transcriptional regulator with XRE-family HTH domain
MAHEKIREAIKRACEQRHWSPLDLSRRSQVSPEAIRRFINGRGEVSTRVIVQLCKALDLDMRSLQ